MDFFIISALTSLILFIVAIVRFPATSFQSIILLFGAALFMYLSVLQTYVPTISSQTSNVPLNCIANSANALTANQPSVVSCGTTMEMITENPVPDATVIALTYDTAYIYTIICFAFALMGIVLKLSESSL